MRNFRKRLARLERERESDNEDATFIHAIVDRIDDCLMVVEEHRVTSYADGRPKEEETILFIDPIPEDEYDAYAPTEQKNGVVMTTEAEEAMAAYYRKFGERFPVHDLAKKAEEAAAAYEAKFGEIFPARDVAMLGNEGEFGFMQAVIDWANKAVERGHPLTDADFGIPDDADT